MVFDRERDIKIIQAFIDWLAKSLTKAQREAVMNGYGAHSVVTAPEMMPLWYAIRKDRGLFHISLTAEGLALRNHLKGQNDG